MMHQIIIKGFLLLLQNTASTTGVFYRRSSLDTFANSDKFLVERFRSRQTENNHNITTHITTTRI